MRVLLLIAIVCLVAACNSSSDGTDAVDSGRDMASDTPAITDAFDPGLADVDIPADVPSASVLTTAQEVSACGGFTRSKSAAPLSYCDAEVLVWIYEESAGTLSLVNSRVSLNCCGEHSMVIEGSDGVYTATETDAPQDVGMRCGCMCVFDFKVVGAPVVGQDLVQLTLVRNVTDQADQPKTVWTGTLDLSAGSGTVVIDATPVVMGCEPI